MSDLPESFTAFRQRLLRNPTIRNAYNRSRRHHAVQDAQQHLETWVDSGDMVALREAIETLQQAASPR